MNASLRASLAALGLLVLSALSTAQDEPGERVERVAAGLATIGIEVDLASLSVESSTARKSGEELLAVRELTLPPDRDRRWMQLVNALGDWRVEDPAELGAREARELGRKRIAFYHQGRRAVVLLTSKDLPLGKLNRTDFALAHELARVWRDSRSDLRESFAAHGRTEEESWIRRCVLEGEARLAAIAVDLTAMGGALDGFTPERLADPMVQAYPEEHLSLACTHGTALALRRWHDGGWDAVHGSWEDPPASTEQILHLEKLGLDPPTAIVLPDAAEGLAGNELLGEDCLGELGMLVLFDALGVDPHVARVAAAGWDGDRVRTWRTDEGELVIFWRSVWDRGVDAEQFAQLLGDHGDGESRRRGRVVDWARTVEHSLAGRLLAAAEETEQPLEEEPEAARGTAELEAAWSAARLGGSFVTDERWVDPVGGFSLPLPARWKVWERGGAIRLVPNSRKHAGASLAVTSLEDEESAKLEGLGFVVEVDERREFDGRPVGWVRHRGVLGQERRGVTVLVPGDDASVAITATVPEASWADLEPIVEEVLAGLRFDAASHPRPAAVENVAEASDEELHDGFQLKVIELRGRRGLPGVDVWVAEHRAINRELGMTDDSRELEARAQRIGQRHRTDERGRVRIPGGRYRYPWVCARHEDRFGYQVVYSSARDETLALPPDRDLVVRVVDGAGVPVAGVPVGIVIGGEGAGSRYLRQERQTEDSGEAHFPRVFSEIPTVFIDDDEVYVTFAFPMKDRPLVHLPLDGSPIEPLTLVLPPTGSILVEVDLTGQDTESRGSDFPLGSAGLVTLTDVEDRFELGFHQPLTRVPRELALERNQVFFPHVGLGLELDVAAGYDRVGERFAGPERTGQRVEIETRPGPKKPEPDYSLDFSDVPVPGGAVLSGRCLDGGRRLLANLEFELTLISWESTGTSGWAPRTFRTDEEGRFRLSIHETREEGTEYAAIIQTLPRAALALESIIEPHEVFTEEDLELGDLLFVSSPVVVSGRVVDQEGEPISGAHCRVAGEVYFGSGARSELGGHDMTAEDGSFLIRGYLEPATPTLSVGIEGFHDRRGIPFTPGERDLLVELEAIEGVCSVRGEIVIDGSDDEVDLAGRSEMPGIWAERVDTPGVDAGQVIFRSWSGSLSFEIQDLEPGYHLIKVARSHFPRRAEDRASGWREPSEKLLAEPFEVLLEPGETTDVGPIYLYEGARRIGVRLVDTEGRRVDGEITRTTTSGFGFSRSTRRTRNGELAFFIDGEEGLDLTVEVSGFRRRSLKNVREDTEVTMLPPLEVVLVLDEEVQLPDPKYRLYVQLVPVRNRSDEGNPPDRGLRTELVEVTGREIEFELDVPGVWRPRWGLGRLGGDSASIKRDLRNEEAPVIGVVDELEPQVFGIPQPSPETINRLIRSLERGR